jgi:hypothetical protein
MVRSRSMAMMRDEISRARSASAMRASASRIAANPSAPYFTRSAPRWRMTTLSTCLATAAPSAVAECATATRSP